MCIASFAFDTHFLLCHCFELLLKNKKHHKGCFVSAFQHCDKHFERHRFLQGCLAFLKMIHIFPRQG